MASENELREQFPGAFIEFDDGQVRLYCRSPIDAYLTRRKLSEIDFGDAVTVYGGHRDLSDGEMDPARDKLLLEVLENPTVQAVIAMFGGVVVDVRPDKKVS